MVSKQKENEKLKRRVKELENLTSDLKKDKVNMEAKLKESRDDKQNGKNEEEVKKYKRECEDLRKEGEEDKKKIDFLTNDIWLC